MKLWARRGFEWAEDGLAGLWCPVLTGATGSTLLDCNPSTNNHGALTGYTDINSAWVGSQYGTANNFNGSTNYGNFSSNAGNLGSKITVACWFRSTQTTLGRIIAKPSVTASTQAWALGINIVTVGKIDFRADNAGNMFGVQSTTNVNTGNIIFAVGTYDQQLASVYVNGLRESSFAQTSALFYGNNLPMQIGRFDTIGQYLLGDTAEIFLMNRAISAGEVLQAFQAGPGGMWQLTPPIRRYATLLARVYSMTAETGSFALTGLPANLLAGRAITADQAQYILSGQATGLQASRFLAADSVGYALLGQNANTIASRLVAADLGSFSSTGFAAGTIAGRKITADVGGYTALANDANLLASRLIAGDPGAYNIVGNAANTLAARSIQADRGSFALTGLDAATLLGRLLDAGASAYSLNGSATDLLSARRITAEQAVLLATGQDAGLLVGRKLGATTGQFILVASDVDFRKSGGGAAPYYYLFLLGGAR